MQHVTILRLRAPAHPPIGRRHNFTSTGIVLRGLAIFACGLFAIYTILR